MSWEEMVPETKPCWCGKGTITYVTEMDDWNRVRHYTRFNCSACKETAEREAQEREKKERERELLLAQAKSLASERYAEAWLTRFKKLNKRQAWQLLTGGSDYPTLGTFYKHVKSEGLEKYLHRTFLHDFSKALTQMGIEDNEIKMLLELRERI